MTASPSRTSDGSVVRRVGEPCLYGARQHACERLLPLDAAGVALEEQPLERPQFRLAKVGPHRCDCGGRLVGSSGSRAHLTALDLVDDRQQ